MTDKVLKTIEDCQMLLGCHTLGVGLSGGADSVCLAHILSKNKEKLGVNVIKGIHIHHGIRGDEADRDLELINAIYNLSSFIWRRIDKRFAFIAKVQIVHRDFQSA